MERFRIAIIGKSEAEISWMSFAVGQKQKNKKHLSNMGLMTSERYKYQWCILRNACMHMSDNAEGPWYGGERKKAKITAKQQNIWLPSNGASSIGNTELWGVGVHYFPDLVFELAVGACGVLWTEKCLHLSGFVKASEQWHWLQQSLGLLGPQFWQIRRPARLG